MISFPMVWCPRAQLLAASSLPVISCSGWKSCRCVPVGTFSAGRAGLPRQHRAPH